MTIFKLHQDANFHYETLRSMGTARYQGSDIAEQLDLMPKIKVNDFDSWYNAWSGLAKQILSTIDGNNLSQYSPVTIRNDWNDPRSLDAFSKWRRYFDIANARLDNPGQSFKLEAEMSEIPCYLYRTAKAGAPTFILGGGFDSNMEELMHVFGFDVLERGYNVLIYEGPGQPEFIRHQHVGFIAEWEKVVSPIVDFPETLDFVDKSKIALLGMSLGGYLAARAAAFEPRLCAVVVIDGVQSFLECCLKLGEDLKEAWEAQDEVAFNKVFDRYGEETSSSGQRWIHDHLKISFQEHSGFKCFQRAGKMSLHGIAGQIKMPAFVGEAAEDIFFLGQPQQVVDGIGSNATLFHFTEDNAAAAHCASGAFAYQNQVICEWFEQVLRAE